MSQILASSAYTTPCSSRTAAMLHSRNSGADGVFGAITSPFGARDERDKRDRDTSCAEARRSRRQKDLFGPILTDRMTVIASDLDVPEDLDDAGLHRELVDGLAQRRSV